RKAAHPPPMQWVGDRPQPIPPSLLASNGNGHVTGDLFIVATTDPAHIQESMVHVPIHEMGIDDAQPYLMHDLLTGERYTWRGVRNYVRIDPAQQPGHVFRVEPAD